MDIFFFRQEEFEDEITAWMQGFINLISFNAAALCDDADTDNPGLLEQLRFAIVRNLTHYAAKYEEEFAPFLPTFTKVILELAARFTSSPMVKHDAVVTKCLQFASKVIEKRRYGSLFGATDMATPMGRAPASPQLKMLVSQMIVPCLSLREADVELLEDNPTEFLRRDME